ncbi:MAG: rhodanese-like domain-containing protein [Oscillospiraceae bacterium]|nr:rhodanese-like domain-containing protein [Oscillospiraceae bacterium]
MESIQAKANFQTINEAQAKEMMEDGDSFILLDVRSEEEYKDQRIDGAISIPLDIIESAAVSKLPDKDARILVHCQSGRRSAEAASILVGFGYSNIYSFGGIANWKYGTISG